MPATWPVAKNHFAGSLPDGRGSVTIAGAQAAYARGSVLDCGGAGFPPAVDPEPLIGVLADDGFEPAVEGLGVAGGVAGDFERGVDAQDVSALGIGPEGEGGDDGGAGVGDKLGEACACAGGDAEDAVIERDGLVDQDGDGLVVPEGFEDAAGWLTHVAQPLTGINCFTRRQSTLRVHASRASVRSSSVIRAQLCSIAR